MGTIDELHGFEVSSYLRIYRVQVPQSNLEKDMLIEAIKTHHILYDEPFDEERIRKVDMSSLCSLTPPSWIIELRTFLTEQKIQQLILTFGNKLENIVNCSMEEIEKINFSPSDLAKFKKFCIDNGNKDIDNNGCRKNESILALELTKDLNLPEYEPQESTFEWLQQIKRQLTNANVNNEIKLRCLKKALISANLCNLYTKVPDEITDYSEYLDQLFSLLRTQAEAKLSKYQYNPKIVPFEFIDKLESLMTQAKGGFTEKELCSEILNRLPAKMKEEVISKKFSDNLEEIKILLISNYYFKKPNYWTKD